MEQRTHERSVEAVITDCDHEDIEPEERIFGPTPFTLRRLDCRTGDEVVAQAGAAEVVLTQYAPLDAHVLARLPECRTIVRYGVGVDNIDVGAATELGIQVVNVPDYGVEEVADHAVALLFSLLRGLNHLVEEALAGNWTYEAAIPLQRVDGLTIGVIGCGRIGGSFVQRMRGIGLPVLVNDPQKADRPPADPGVHMVSLDEVLAHSDAVSLHVPLTDATHHLIDGAALAKMRPGSYLINTARGGLVDSRALLAALDSGHVAGAGLDVLEEEPAPPGDPLVTHPRTIVTPHSAWYSEQAYETLKSEVAREALRALRAEPPRCPVNAPRNARTQVPTA